MAYFPNNKNSTQRESSGAYTTVDELLGLRYLAKDISLETRKSSSAIMDGDSRTSFRGRGMEFSEVRPYQAGDDVRTIDWRVTARAQKPYTKLFQEEKERPVFLLVDQRSPMFFSSANVFKSVYAAQLACVIGWAALANNDRIGALLFADSEQKDLRARRGKHAILNLINQLHLFNEKLSSPIAKQNTNNMKAMLMDLRRIARPGSAVYLISDFHDYDASCDESLAVLSRHTDVSVISIFDHLEANLPQNKQLTISDSNSRLTIAANAKSFIQNYAEQFSEQKSVLRKACQRSGITFASMDVATPIEDRIRDTFESTLSKKRRQVRHSPAAPEGAL